jgi:hypothetical protein
MNCAARLRSSGARRYCGGRPARSWNSGYGTTSIGSSVNPATTFENRAAAFVVTRLYSGRIESLEENVNRASARSAWIARPTSASPVSLVTSGANWFRNAVASLRACAMMVSGSAAAELCERSDAR